MSFTPVPSLGSLLRGITIPPVGGDTMFTNMYKAYDTLSDGMKKMIAGLHGIHTGTRKVDDPKSDAREGAAQDQSADRPAGRARPSRDRPQGALYRREGVVLRRHDAGGEQAADRLPGQARDAAAVRLPPPVARRTTS